jgi:hypothetical protein
MGRGGLVSGRQVSTPRAKQCCTHRCQLLCAASCRATDVGSMPSSDNINCCYAICSREQFRLGGPMTIIGKEHSDSALLEVRPLVYSAEGIVLPAPHVAARISVLACSRVGMSIAACASDRACHAFDGPSPF